MAVRFNANVAGNWRVTFRFVDGVAVDVDLIDYHIEAIAMDNHEHVTLANPSHPGEILRDCIDGHGATVAGTAQQHKVSRAKLNRILAGRGRIGPDTALALERLGWSAAEFWLRLQMKYDLAIERRKQAD